VLATTVPLLLAVVLAVGVAGGAGLLTPALRVGDRAPDFALADLNGEPVRLADYVGRPVIVNFWASWCLPCVEEFPLLAAALDDHADIGLAVIGIVYRDRSEAARARLRWGEHALLVAVPLSSGSKFDSATITWASLRSGS